MSTDKLQRDTSTAEDVVSALENRSSTPPPLPDAELREKLAELAHEQWSGWVRYMLGRLEQDDRDEWIARWRRQIRLHYSELRPDEQDSDRREADRVLAVVAPALAERDAQIEQLRVQLAGCGVAAHGGTSESQIAKRGDYGWSDSYQATLELAHERDLARASGIVYAADGVADAPGPAEEIAEAIKRDRERRIVAEEQLATARAEVERLRELPEALDRLQAERDAQIAELQGVRCELSAANYKITVLEETRDRLHEQLAESRDARGAIAAERDVLEEIKQKLNAYIAQLEDETVWRSAYEALQAELAEGYGYLRRLFERLAPECEPFDKLPALATQIDNYIAGLNEQLAAARAELQAEFDHQGETQRQLNDMGAELCSARAEVERLKRGVYLIVESYFQKPQKSPRAVESMAVRLYWGEDIALVPASAALAPAEEKETEK